MTPYRHAAGHVDVRREAIRKHKLFFHNMLKKIFEAFYEIITFKSINILDLSSVFGSIARRARLHLDHHTSHDASVIGSSAGCEEPLLSAALNPNIQLHISPRDQHHDLMHRHLFRGESQSIPAFGFFNENFQRSPSIRAVDRTEIVVGLDRSARKRRVAIEIP